MTLNRADRTDGQEARLRHVTGEGLRSLSTALHVASAALLGMMLVVWFVSGASQPDAPRDYVFPWVLCVALVPMLAGAMSLRISARWFLDAD